MVRPLLLLLLNFYALGAWAQHPPPELINATVINDAGDVKLIWERKDTTDDNMQIRRDSLGNVNGFTTIITIYNKDDTIWTDSNSEANKKPRAYRLNIDLDDENWEEQESNKFNTTHLTLQFDTCSKRININWSRFVEPPPDRPNFNFNDTIKVKHYNIWKKTDNQDYKKIQTTSDTSYRDSNIEFNLDYKYYVEAVRDNDSAVKSQSNRDSVFIRMPYNPDFIRTKKISYENEDVINLQYSIAENSELEKYVLLRSENPEGPYDTVQTLQTNEKELYYTDEETGQSNSVYYYHTAAMNQCDQLTTRSDTLSNILLSVENNELTNELNWNELGKDNTTYSIYRKTGSSSYEQIKTTNRTPYYDNELESFLGRDYSGKFCYYIEAKSNNGDNNSLSISKEKCLYVEPEIFIPNSFTPNNDGNNDEFRPRLSFLPNHYHLIIYDRSGNTVFESKDPEETWRGEIKRGDKAPSGTYIYYLEVKNPENKMIKKRGRINVFYP
ncbi:MAG: gliding motility-associated C-terminal domain-containing protein [Bacteroidales bacterium]